MSFQINSITIRMQEYAREGRISLLDIPPANRNPSEGLRTNLWTPIAQL